MSRGMPNRIRGKPPTTAADPAREGDPELLMAAEEEPKTI